MRTATTTRAPIPGLARIADATGDRQFAIALARGLEVLRAFGPADRALTNRELCDRTGLPKATVSRMTHTLTLLGYLSRGPDQRVSLGAGVLALGYPLLAGLPVRQIARPWLERLARESGCTVNLGTRDRLSAVYVDSCRVDRANPWVPDIGSPLPLLTSAMGRALILARPAAEQAAILNRLKVDDPRRFRDERPLLDAERDAYRRRGFTHAVGQWRPDVHAVAVALRPSDQGELFAVNCTLSLSAPERRSTHAARLVDEVAPEMIETARRIEAACRAEHAPRQEPPTVIRDPARLDDLLATLRAFVREECIPLEARIDREDAIPEPMVERMRTLGLFGHSIPEAYGGAGLTTEELARVNIEVSQAAPVFRARFGGNTGIASEALIADGLPEQKRAWLPRLASGEITGCFALTEPEAGSDATALRTRAVPALGPDGRAGWRIDGTKCYITNAPIADLFTVFARTDDAPRGASGITAFLMPRRTPGLSTGPAYRKLGQHGSPVGEVHLDGVWVPEDAVLGGRPGEGFRSAMRALNKQRINLAGLCVGPAIRLLDEAIAHARGRKQFGQPIGEFQLVQAMLADSATEVAAARALVLETARKRDAGEDVTMDVSMCKLLASETCGRVADRAVQILGGAGYVEDHAIVRLYRDVRLFRLYEGTSQIHQVNIAKHLLRGTA